MVGRWAPVRLPGWVALANAGLHGEPTADTVWDAHVDRLIAEARAHDFEPHRLTRRAPRWPWVYSMATGLRPPASVLTTATLDDIRRLTSELRQAHRQRRAEQDQALVLAMARSVGDLSFNTAHLWQHAMTDGTLRQAFTVAGVSSVPRLGKRLARLAGCPVAGFVVTRIGRDAGGAVWSILPS
jgi:hypothetical protein